MRGAFFLSFIIKTFILIALFCVRGNYLHIHTLVVEMFVLHNCNMVLVNRCKRLNKDGKIVLERFSCATLILISGLLVIIGNNRCKSRFIHWINNCPNPNDKIMCLQIFKELFTCCLSSQQGSSKLYHQCYFTLLHVSGYNVVCTHTKERTRKQSRYISIHTSGLLPPCDCSKSKREKGNRNKLWYWLKYYNLQPPHTDDKWFKYFTFDFSLREFLLAFQFTFKLSHAAHLMIVFPHSKTLTTALSLFVIRCCLKLYLNGIANEQQKLGWYHQSNHLCLVRLHSCSGCRASIKVCDWMRSLVSDEWINWGVWLMRNELNLAWDNVT